MNQMEALQAAREAFPHIAGRITLDRDHKVGYSFGNMDTFMIWDHTDGNCRILATSHTSWEHALALARFAEATRSSFPPDTSSVDEPAVEMPF